MSGGHFGYQNDSVCHEIFGWEVSCDYGERGFSQSSHASRINPFEDREISELVFDVFCLIHSYDWYASGDNGREAYQKDVKRFKNKWFDTPRDKRLKEYVDDAVEYMKTELYELIGGSK